MKSAIIAIPNSNGEGIVVEEYELITTCPENESKRGATKKPTKL